MKQQLTNLLELYLRAKPRVIQRRPSKNIMEKELFIEAITLLQEIEDRRDFMEEEMGMDMTSYEEKFIQVIENLFNINYSPEQVAIVQYYVYEYPLEDSKKGKINLNINGKKVEVANFDTPEDVWNVVQSLRKKSK